MTGPIDTAAMRKRTITTLSLGAQDVLSLCDALDAARAALKKVRNFTCDCSDCFDCARSFAREALGEEKQR